MVDGGCELLKLTVDESIIVYFSRLGHKMNYKNVLIG